MSVFSEYKKNMMSAAHNDRIRLALSRGIASYRSNVNTALEKFPHSVQLAEEVRQIKAQSILDMEKLAQQACEVIESNTFGANRYRLAKFGLEEHVRAINLGGARLARDAREIEGKEVLVAGSMGPLGQALAPLFRAQPSAFRYKRS